MKSKIRIGTRRSQLALWQAKWVASQLELVQLAGELVPMDTKGDQLQNLPIPEIGSKGVFTAKLEKELASGNIDIAVHSAKDMPSELPAEFEIIAYTVREQAHDVVISFNTHLDLKESITIGTSSSRRVALFHHYYPNINMVSVRGNLQTRLKKMEHGGMDGLALAYAGIHRLGLNGLIRHSMAKNVFVPAVGQGSIVIEVSKRINPQKKARIRECLNDPSTEYCLTTERAFLYTIQGGCSIPAFAYAELSDGVIKVIGGIISLDGNQVVQLSLKGPLDHAHRLGEELGRKVLGSGGAKILEEINSHLND